MPAKMKAERTTYFSLENKEEIAILWTLLTAISTKGNWKIMPKPIRYLVINEKYSDVDMSALIWSVEYVFKKYNAAGKLTKYAKLIPININIFEANSILLRRWGNFWGRAGSTNRIVWYTKTGNESKKPKKRDNWNVNSKPPAGEV